jgi:hypothetical protein
MSAPGPYGAWAPAPPQRPAPPPPPQTPPPGPGVVPPFPAPPTEGRSTRVWLGLGAAGLAVALCCGGGIAALVGIVVTTPGAVNEQAHAAVREYLDALKQADYGAAYDALCESERRVESRDSYIRRHRADPRVTGYALGEVDLNRTPVEVPADITYDTGSRTTVTYILSQDPSTATFEVCGIDR